MFRIPPKLRRTAASNIAWRWHVFRRQSSQASNTDGGKGKIALAAVGGTTTFVLGTIGYSYWSPENRKNVEDFIPGSNYVLEAILGPEQVVPVPKTVPPPVFKPYVPIKKEKKIEHEDKWLMKDPSEIVSPSVDVGLIVVPAPELTAPPPTSDLLSELASSSPSSEQTRLAPGVKPVVVSEKENIALTQLLEDLKKDAARCITNALSVAEDTADAIKKHAEEAINAIDSDNEKSLVVISDLAHKKVELSKIVEIKVEEANSAITKLQTEIKNGLKCQETRENKSLLEAEDSVTDLLYSINNIKNIIEKAIIDSKVVGDFGHLVAAGRKQFEAEVHDLMSDVNLEEKSKKLTTDELNILLAHMHHKVIKMQKLLEKHQALEIDRFKETVDRQRVEDLNLLDSRVQAELDKQRQHLNLQFKQRSIDLRDDLEAELRSQLKRQAAAHSDHLYDVLTVQEKELDNKWETKLMEKVQEERAQYYKDVAVMRGQLDGLKSALTTRADSEKDTRNASELWLACESLRNTLRLGVENAKSWKDQLVSLNDQVKAINTAIGDNNPYVTAVLGSISKEVLDRGVYPESALRERFIKVNQIAKKVSLIGENGGSLAKYLLSYVQSFLVVESSGYLPLNEMRNQEVNVDELNNHEILARARYCLDKDDLTQALRYMNLLRGESRNISSDWIKEARLTLEIVQVADALSAYSAATVLKAI